MNPYNSKKSNLWGTPVDLYESLDKEFKFDYDPCPFPKPESFDGLLTDWGKCNFVNPPYSDVGRFARKCREEQKKGNVSVLLIPARTSTGYFHDWILPFAEIRFIRGRLKFVGLSEENRDVKNPAGFASLVCVYR